MQKVTLDDLKKLLPNGKVHENEYDLGGLSFKDVCNTWENAYKMYDRNVRKAYVDMVAMFKDYCPPIELVGRGSSRTAFACVGGKCIKVAVKPAGIAQNRQEAKHTMKKLWTRSWSCFTQTYDASKNYGVLLSECCAPMKDDKQFADAFGLSHIDVLEIILWALTHEKSKGDVKKSIKTLKSKYQDMKSKEKEDGYADFMDLNIKHTKEAIEQLEKIFAGKQLNAGQLAILQIAQFWKKNGIDELLPGDVSVRENWGFAIRNGKLAPVMLDTGFSEEVYQQFY